MGFPRAGSCAAVWLPVSRLSAGRSLLAGLRSPLPRETQLQAPRWVLGREGELFAPSPGRPPTVSARALSDRGSAAFWRTRSAGTRFSGHTGAIIVFLQHSRLCHIVRAACVLGDDAALVFEPVSWPPRARVRPIRPLSASVGPASGPGGSDKSVRGAVRSAICGEMRQRVWDGELVVTVDKLRGSELASPAMAPTRGAVLVFLRYPWHHDYDSWQWGTCTSYTARAAGAFSEGCQLPVNGGSLAAGPQGLGECRLRSVIWRCF